MACSPSPTLSRLPAHVSSQGGSIRYLFVVPEYVTDFGQNLKVRGGGLTA